MASFFDEINQNRIKSILLMLVFGAMFAFIVYLLALFLRRHNRICNRHSSDNSICIFFVFLWKKLVLKMSGANADKKQYPQLYNIVEGLALASQLQMPEVYIINDPNPNAFATGKNKDHAQ